MHEINQAPAPKTNFTISIGFEPNKGRIRAKAIRLGYIRLILLLYQLSKRAVLPKNIVNPEAKKNKLSPIAPPVAK